MAALSSKIATFVAGFITVFIDVSLFWWLRLDRYLTTPTRKQLLLETLEDAQVYEEWEAAAQQLDKLVDNYVWRDTPPTKVYDYNLILDRTDQLYDALDHDDVMTMCHTLRSGLVRNLGNITDPKLYNRAYAGTKLIIERYINECVLAVQYVTAYRST
ncbi:hypothetical protein B0A55_09642, partial [Friedmanniomyces simplex]